MKIKQTILLFALMMGFSGLFISPAVYAGNCGGVDTSIINCDETGVGTCSDGSTPVDKKCTTGNYIAPKAESTGLWGILILIINILTAGIGIVAVGGIIYASMLYAASGGDAGQVKESKTIIFNIVVGIVAYALMFSFLNFIIPGGLFK